MRWLRKQRDLIGLIMVWGLLLQSLVVPISTTAHAATAAGDELSAGAICTTRTANPVPAGTFAPDEQKQSHKGPDCQCCHMNCRHGCGGTCGGILGAFAYLVTPRGVTVTATQKSAAYALYDAALQIESRPRAPPLA